MKIREQDLERYLMDLSDSYAADSDYMRTRTEIAYSQGVRNTVSQVLALLSGESSVIYPESEGK